ncbi:hypothetical protein N8772_01055 [Rickettsiales bacterium]|nr:hypothetical protein [Rickettsiales bacterium]MDB2550353.1 hypothetical protein [Rickettsiales bacterium]
MKKNHKLGFSLLEVSVILLIIGILLASISAGKSMIKTSRITSAQTLTSNSPISSVEPLAIWLEPVLSESIVEDETYEGQTITGWQNITNYFVSNRLTAGGDPSYSEAAINDIPSITFDGTDSIDLNAPIQRITGSNFAIFIVEDRDNATGKLIDSDNLVIEYTTDNLQVDKNTNTDIINFASASSGPAINYLSFASYQSGSAPVGTAYYRNRGVGLDVNSITADGSDGNADSIGSISTATLGNDVGGFIGDISELIVYGQSLTFVELNEVLNYLSAKYRIPLNRT